jgi:LysM repeat protein
LYGSTTEAIIQANGLDSSALIYVGQGLIVPVRLAAPATSTPTATPIVVVVTATLQPATGGSSEGTGGGQNVYVVQPGDTLSRIATRFNTTIAALAQLNGIVNPNLIYVGQRLTVPGTGGTGGIVPTSPPPVVTVPGSASPVPPTPVPTPVQQKTYTVQPGDNLFRLSLRFGVSMQALMQTNRIANANLIYVGQVLVIP